MRNVVVLGGGTAGTMVANKLHKRLDRSRWSISVVDRDDVHRYQPGYLLLPFGVYETADLRRSRHSLIPDGVHLVLSEIDRVAPEENRVLLSDGRALAYDYLIVATGVQTRPDQTPGLLGQHWRQTIFDFYTYDGAVALAEKLRTWDGGRLVVNIVDMPIKCPVAPLEFAFLADAYFADRGRRDRVDITYVTPLSGAFTKPIASAHLSGMLDQRNIRLETDFMLEKVDEQTLVSYDERVVPFDLLVTVPLNMGADFVARSGLGNEMNFVPVDRHTFLAKDHDNIFAIGDANDIPTSKAGSVAHFSVETFVPNFLRYVDGLPMREEFDGHANCFIESGHGKGLLIDFDYDTEPLPGKYPLPGIGPFSLLEETRANHLGKLAFRWAYWNALMPGRPLPVTTRMSMRGKHPVRPRAETDTAGQRFGSAESRR
jgi:sulfide:quinone oxidoreductase